MKKPEPAVSSGGEQLVSSERRAFLKQNEIERRLLDKEIAMLERKLGAGKDSKKRRKLNQAIEVEGFGKGFMDFIDGIDSKLKKG